MLHDVLPRVVLYWPVPESSVASAVATSRGAERVSARLDRRRAVVERCEPVARGVLSRGSGVRQPFEALASALAGHTELGPDDPPRGTLPMSA